MTAVRREQFDGLATEQLDGLAIQRNSPFMSRVRVFYLFAIDLGFLFSTEPVNDSVRRQFVSLRASKPATSMIFGDVRVGLEFGGLSGGRLETDDIRDRTRKAEAAGGKSIWARSILDHEAPYLFKVNNDALPVPNPIRVASRLARFEPYSQEVRLFPRGVLAIEQGWNLDARNEHLTIQDFIIAMKQAKRDASELAWIRIREVLQVLRQRDRLFAGLDVTWSDTAETAESFIRQHLVKHALVFLDAPPGLRADTPPGLRTDAEPQLYNQSLDDLGYSVKAAIAGVLNLTQWFDIYARAYPDSVFADAVRNRRDEIYLTDNDSSVIVLADYWSEGDTLGYYQADLVLATQFELARLTHLRYLAYYLRNAPEAEEALSLRDDGGREALGFVLDVQNAVLRSNYDHPAEALIQHGFTRRFLSQVGAQRGTKASLDELESYIEKILRAIELRTGLELSEKNYGVASRTLIVTWILMVLTGAVVAFGLVALAG
jgi:hypothetical protein